MRDIDTYVPPIEQFVIWKGGFSLDECDQIKWIGELCGRKPSPVSINFTANCRKSYSMQCPHDHRG